MARSINLVTSIPGPKSQELLRRKECSVADALTLQLEAFIESGNGALITDIDGNTFIDLSGGLGVLNVGHAHPRVTAALREQAARFVHTEFSVAPYASYVELAERLAAIAPGQSPKKVAFFNSGAEAVEKAIKIAKLYTGRKALIAFENGCGPFAPDVFRIPYAYCYHCPIRQVFPDCQLECTNFLERAFTTMVAPEDVAAVIIEPVQGEGGFIAPPPGYMGRIKEICDRHGILLIVDEIETGFGRTGKMFASEHWGVEPDLMTVAKSLAAGVPMSGVIGKREIMDAAPDSSIGGAHGNPLGCVAGLAVLEIIEEDNLIERARVIGEYMRQRLIGIADRYGLVGNIRGLGAMIGAELVTNRRTQEPAVKETREIIDYCLEHGVVAIKTGIYGNVIRMLVPLVITDEQLGEAMDVMEEAFAAVTGSTVPGDAVIVEDGGRNEA